MKLPRALLTIGLLVFAGCSSGPQRGDPYADFYHRNGELASFAVKDPTFENLNAGFGALCDRILTTGKDRAALTDQEKTLLSRYIDQNRLFERPGFDRKWMFSLRETFAHVAEVERNRIAHPLSERIFTLFNRAEAESRDER